MSCFVTLVWHLVCFPLQFLHLHSQGASFLLCSPEAVLQARCIHCFPLQLLHLHRGIMHRDARHRPDSAHKTAMYTVAI